MLDVLLTQNSTPIFKYIVALLGMIMNALFELLNLMSIPNVGVVIILFTIVMYMLMLPITIKQQKFSKLSAKMNPEIQAIQAKYKNRKDNESMMAMNQETQAVYAKYGVSPAGSCLQLLITMPVLFALYRVIYSIPAYVPRIKLVFTAMMASLSLFGSDPSAVYTDTENYTIASTTAITQEASDSIELFTTLYSNSSGLTTYVSALKKPTTLNGVQNRFVDMFNHFSASDWTTLENYYEENKDQYANYDEIMEAISSTQATIKKYNTFLGLNVGYTPSSIVKGAWGSNWLLVIGALLIPLLAGLSQFINVKLMPQQPQQNQSETGATMASSMKMMNMIMPIISIFFCWSLQVGVGLYWIGSSVVRTVQQILINKHIDKMDLDAMMKANIEKNNAKRAKMGLPPQTLNNNANINTKKINTAPVRSQEERDADVKKSTAYYNSNAKPGSLASKVNMVKQYNEKNNK